MMFPVLFGLAILVWMWAAAMNEVVAKFAAKASPGQQRVYLAMLVLAGALVLVLVLAWFMPGSPLSMGWSRERLASLVSAAAMTALAVTALALWRAHVRMPAMGLAGAANPGAAASFPAKKKRP
ncbi:MAG: hypothetical protein ACLGHE_01890 [Gammaproteobacteria bacterium]